MKTKLVIAALALSMSGVFVTAQDQSERPQRPPGGGPGGLRGGFGGGPLMAALDANKDGELDAAELANATAALKKLDKNSDGKLTAEELRPMRPGGRPGGQSGQEGGDRPPRRDRDQ